MAKVMFLVCFPAIHGEKEGDNKSDHIETTDKDDTLEGEKEVSAGSFEEKDDNQNSVENEDKPENGNEKNDNGEIEDKSNTADSEHSERNDKKVDFKDVDNSNADSPDVITEISSANSLEQDATEAAKETPEFVRFISQSTSLLEDVKQTLSSLNVTGVQWNLTEDGMQVGTFLADYGSQCELIIKRLTRLNIGMTENSSLSVFPASICIEEKPEEDVEMLMKSNENVTEKVSEFRKSIKSRLVVDQVVASVQGEAMFTFDYLMLVILASFVAVMGLLEASSVVLVASMLISPLMGPILAAVFGTVIRKADLFCVGVSSELKGLAICILVGFILGFIPACLETGSYGWRSSNEWPTIEMSSRGAFRSLPVGILIAIPSGAGVALSILGGKIGSLVGVAISASLLPPAVNAGLLWANAIVVSISPPLKESTGNPRGITNATLNTTSSHVLGGSDFECPLFINNDYIPLHSCNMVGESFMLGLVSLSLTILNIACIIFMGILVLKLKEVAPLFHTSAANSEKDFFCKDLRVARESYVTTKGKSAAAMRQQWMAEYKKFIPGNKSDDSEEECAEAEQEIDNIIESVQDSSDVTDIVEKMPVRPKRWSHIAWSSISNTHVSNPFDFNSPKGFEAFELSGNRLSHPKTLQSSSVPSSPQTDSAVAGHYRLYKYVPPENLMSNQASLWRRGKFLPKLKLPQASRFTVTKIKEPVELKRKQSQLSAVQEEPSQQASGTKEMEPLLAKKI